MLLGKSWNVNFENIATCGFLKALSNNLRQWD